MTAASLRSSARWWREFAEAAHGPKDRQSWLAWAAHLDELADKAAAEEVRRSKLKNSTSVNEAPLAAPG
jgi:hypothetical protein